MLLNKMELIFPISPLPKRLLLDEYDNSEFSEGICNAFLSKQWVSVTVDDWVNIACIEVVSSYMSPRAFHYYLPSLLLGVLEEGSYIDWGLKAVLPQNQSREPRSDWWKDYVACFNLKQRRFIQEYILSVLEFVQQGSEEEWLAQVALDTVWVVDS